ncbi:RtcB family protein [Candidatus Woesearchaeota archaeon]|nr:RtcB family protein [Candidatus Woesearchaeota archaeon]
MVEVKKINEFVWQIPKQGGMKVPGTIYASEKLMEKIKQDNTLQQVANVAHLKGIIKHSIALPDAHSGYGFPIGGVAAFDMEEGVISPGGVGYDINCLTEDSKILTEFGYSKNIGDFEQDFVEVENPNSEYVLRSKKSILNVISFDYGQNSFSSKNILYFMKKKHFGSIIKIKTKLGYSLKVTEEHPLLTKLGMIQAKSLKKYQEISINPFEGVSFEDITDDFNILEDKEFSKEERKELEKRNILPLKLSNPKTPILTKLFGYLLGDGNIYMSNKRGRVCSYGSEEDLKTIKEDFERLGFSARIYKRTRTHKIIDQYGTKFFTADNFELHLSSKSLVKLFYNLGYPKGIKTSTSFLVPDWIIQGPKWIKRLFLSGLFGAELSSPRVHTKTGFDCPVLSMNKNKYFIDNGRKFCIQVMSLLEEFDVKTDKISEREEYKNQQGKTCRVRLQISSDEDNLIRLWSKIGFSYNKKRELLSNIGILYIKEKKLLTQKRSELTNKTKELKEKGLKLKEVQSLLKCEYANKRFIERHYYESAGQRISLNFISFEDFKKLKSTEYSKYGIFFDSIDTIVKEDYKGYVYDLNIDKTHNFVADNIVVSNCGVRMLRTDLKVNDVLSKRKELLNELYKEVPAGVGKGGIMKLPKSVLMEVLSKGARWAIEQGYGTEEDLQKTEEYGNMEANAHDVSEKALQRGMPQLGTLGAGNHFLELQKVEQIFDRDIAKSFGIDEENQITVMIHCGSRGLGHQVASDYIKKMEDKYGIANLPDRELINAPISSELGQKYYNAMCASVNFAFSNRQMIAHWTRDVFEKIFGTKEGMKQIYDVCHNLAKFEKHEVEGKTKEVCVHRKGATRSFGPGREEIPKAYRSIGQPVIIPGSMGTASYLLVGTKKAEEISFGSTAHGAGRVGSRSEALRTLRGEQVARDLAKKGIEVKGPWKGLAEEAPQMYKDIDEVVRASHKLGIGKLVARLVPLAVMKG